MLDLPPKSGFVLGYAILWPTLTNSMHHIYDPRACQSSAPPSYQPVVFGDTTLSRDLWPMSFTPNRSACVYFWEGTGIDR